MTRSSTIATALDKHKIASSVVYLLFLEITVTDPFTYEVVDTVRLVCNNENVVWQGNTYTACFFEVDATYENGKLPNVTITVRDYFEILQPRMQQHGGAMGSPVRLLVVNNSVADAPPDIDEQFAITSAQASGSDWSIAFTLGSENPLSLAFPSRKQFRDICMFLYKGAECGYAGTLPTCDYTLNGANGCAAHDNQINFGGYPGLQKTSYS